MTSLESRLTSLERTVRLQRMALLAGLFVGVITWSAGAFHQEPAESLKGKELLLEDGNGKTIAKLGGDGAGGVALVLSADTEKGEKAIRLSVTDKGCVVSASFDGATSQLQASGEGAVTQLTSKEGNQVSAAAHSTATVSFTHKDEKFPRISMTSDPKMWPTIILRESDESIRWQSPKTGR